MQYLRNVSCGFIWPDVSFSFKVLIWSGCTFWQQYQAVQCLLNVSRLSFLYIFFLILFFHNIKACDRVVHASSKDLPAPGVGVSAFSRGNLKEPTPSFVCHCPESCSTTIHSGSYPGPPESSLQGIPWSPHRRGNPQWRRTSRGGCCGWCAAWA